MGCLLFWYHGQIARLGGMETTEIDLHPTIWTILDHI